MRETHLWYELDVAMHADSRSDSGFHLSEATPEILPAVRALQPISESTVYERMRGGGRLWTGQVGGELAFVCWTFAGTTPVLVARGGALGLPGGVECLEDSLTSSAFRGQGIAPVAWRALAARLHEDGVSSLLTKVAVENVPSCRAVVKAGFQEIAVMQALRLGPRLRVEVHAARSGNGPHLAEQLAR